MSLFIKMRVGLMQKIESLLQQLDENCDPNEVRDAIADLIVANLQAMKDLLGYWEKTHFANAIAAFALNTHSLYQSPTAWLRLCLVNLEKVLAPKNQRNENHLLEDRHLESLTYDQLVEAIESVRKHD